MAFCLLAMTFTLMSCNHKNGASEKVLTGNIVDVLAKDIYPSEVIIKDGKITSIKRIDGEFDTYYHAWLRRCTHTHRKHTHAPRELCSHGCREWGSGCYL